jgi:arginase
MPKDILLIGAPLDCGKERRGCLMGPDAFRTAGLPRALRDLGHRVRDLGNVAPDQNDLPARDGLKHLPETVGWTTALSRHASDAMEQGLPIFMGGDHALSLGTVHGVAAHAAKQDRPLFVLWLDAHTDFHTLDSTDSGNLHGTPLGYVTGRAGFDGFPPVPTPVPLQNLCIIGLRSVDHAERTALEATPVRRHDMRQIDEHGIAALLEPFLRDVAAQNGLLHVSLDVDFLDPAVAPAVGTTVPGGATVREAHLVMEMLHDSGLMTSLDLVELNPMLDERGRTAELMTDLAASALGRQVFDRPTRGF